jgi:hypothetical protein
MNVRFKMGLEIYKNDGGNMYLFNGTKSASLEVQDSDQRN